MDALRSGDGGPGAVDAVLVPGLGSSGDGADRDVEAAAEAAVVSDVLGVGVVDVEGQAMSLALLQRDLERVIAEVADVFTPGVRDAAVLGKGDQALCDGGRGADRGGVLEVHGNGEAGHNGLRLGDVGGSRGGGQDRLGAGAVRNRAERGEVGGVELICPVSAGVGAGGCGVDQVVALIADVVDRQGEVPGDGALEADVVEVEVRRAP